jgi:hypothetical protein
MAQKVFIAICTQHIVITFLLFIQCLFHYIYVLSFHVKHKIPINKDHAAYFSMSFDRNTTLLILTGSQCYENKSPNWTFLNYPLEHRWSTVSLFQINIASPEFIFLKINPFQKRYSASPSYPFLYLLKLSAS